MNVYEYSLIDLQYTIYINDSSSPTILLIIDFLRIYATRELQRLFPRITLSYYYEIQILSPEWRCEKPNVCREI